MTEFVRRAESLSASHAIPVFLAVFLASVAAQVLLYETVLRPSPSHATRYGVSAALGLLDGQGLTVSDAEAERVKRVDHRTDLREFADPEAPRYGAHEPLPGVSLLFYAVSKLPGPFHLSRVVYLQILLYALLSGLLYLELRARHPVAALFAAFGWGLFVPQFRVSLSPGHDALTSLTYLAGTLAVLRFHRTESLPALGLAGVLCGLGLWFRSYFFLFPAGLAAILIVFRRSLAPTFNVFLVPVLVFAVGLSLARSSDSGTTHRFVRGGLWHNFFTGVGQFDNDLGLVSEDRSVRLFAERLSGRDFAFPNFQYDPEYNTVLESAGRRLIAEDWPTLVRNGVYRMGWLFFPALMPSGTFAAVPGVRPVLLAVGIPLSLLALLGFAMTARRDPVLALLLVAPWLSLLPLSIYFFNAKVPTQAFFGHLVLAGVALETLVRQRIRGAEESKSTEASVATRLS